MGEQHIDTGLSKLGFASLDLLVQQHQVAAIFVANGILDRANFNHYFVIHFQRYATAN